MPTDQLQNVSMVPINYYQHFNDGDARERKRKAGRGLGTRLDQSTSDNFAITSLTSGWQIAKGGKGALFYSRITVNDGKGRRLQ